MTYSEKLKELHHATTSNMRLYAEYARELKKMIDDGMTLDGEQIREQDHKFREFQSAMTDYNKLLGHVTRNRVPLDQEFQSFE
jgi:hypothetical protein